MHGPAVFSTFTSYLKDTEGIACQLYTVLYNVPAWSPDSSFKTSPKGLSKTDAVTLHRFELSGEKPLKSPFLVQLELSLIWK